MFFFNDSDAQPIDLLSLRGNGKTSFQQEEHWRKKYAGRYVDWTGEVQNVFGSSGHDGFISIKLADGKIEAFLTLRNHDSWSNTRRLQKLQIGQTIHFRAKLPDCDNFWPLSLKDGRLK